MKLEKYQLHYGFQRKYILELYDFDISNLNIYIPPPMRRKTFTQDFLQDKIGMLDRGTEKGQGGALVVDK